MKLTSIIAVYVLFWWFCLFLVLPLRLQHKRGGSDEMIPGQAESAPPRFSVRRTALWTTILAATLFALFYVNYVGGWLGPEMFDFFTPHQHLHM